MTTPPRTTPGIVYLVGAGPGSLGLLTLRAAECLRQADVILYDYLANPAALEHARPGAELIGLGHHREGRSLSPDEITARMLAEAKKGRIVARLKAGDPLIFGRGGDEAEACREAGIPFEIVPGITSGLATASLCEIPLTHHQDASAVALVTGHEREDKEQSHLDYKALAAFPGTLVVYMGVRRVEHWCGQLMEHGKPPDTPVAIVRWCSRADQRTVRCTLGTVVEVIGKAGLRPPAIFVIGKVVDRAPKLSWFAARPLFNTRVLVAGSESAARRMRDRLAVLGADVIVQPAVRIVEPPEWTDADAALDRLDDYDWLVFSSASGVDHLVKRLFERGGDVRRLGRVRLAAAGSGTAQRLAHYHLAPDLAPTPFQAESLARDLAGDAKPGRVLLAGGDGRSVLLDALHDAGVEADQVAVYAVAEVTEPNPDVVKALQAGEIDWIAVTSQPTAESLARLYGEMLRGCRIASISPMTSATLREVGLTPAVEASPHATAALVDAIVEHG
jgi:uroporphyrinogen III methyltransferase/synthase